MVVLLSVSGRCTVYRGPRFIPSSFEPLRLQRSHSNPAARNGASTKTAGNVPAAIRENRCGLDTGGKMTVTVEDIEALRRVLAELPRLQPKGGQ